MNFSLSLVSAGLVNYDRFKKTYEKAINNSVILYESTMMKCPSPQWDDLTKKFTTGINFQNTDTWRQILVPAYTGGSGIEKQPPIDPPVFSRMAVTKNINLVLGKIFYEEFFVASNAVSSKRMIELILEVMQKIGMPMRKQQVYA